MRILVIGGAGFIGKRVVKKLLELGNEVAVLDSVVSDTGTKTADKLISFLGDIRLFSDVVKSVYGSNVDRIIHLAYTLTAEGEIDPYRAIQVNVLGTCNVFEAARIYGVRRVVFCSSIAAYGPQECYGDRVVTEDEILMKPTYTYGATKVLNEFMASEFENKYGVKVPILRIGAVYGKGREGGGLTAWTSDLVTNVVRGKSAYIPLRPDQRGSFVYVDDVAEQLVGLCVKEELGHKIYNSGGYTATVGEFAQIVRKYYSEAEIVFDEKALQWPYSHIIDGSRIERELGWNIRDLRSGLFDQINEERSPLGLKSMERKT